MLSLLPVVSFIGWTVIAIAAVYTWGRMVSRRRRNPDYVESLKAAGQYQRYKLGLFFAFMLMMVALVFAAISLSFV
ncbi:hypothetical protein LCGC14_0347810 [marine sediment metagenome]|uniref:Uncharacterized protein n=1 Tax=marine sediment metagenome TaxID=412755 RepID=A0A0F9THJ2_9ZZZZ